MTPLNELIATLIDIVIHGDPLSHLAAWWDVVRGRIDPHAPCGYRRVDG
jgi:hypothetical protein